MANQSQPAPFGGNRCLLGMQYPPDSDIGAMDQGFLQDFRSRLWFTYRENFPPIERSEFRSDAGWGCMLRSAQMIMAQGLILHFLGRSWRLPENPKLANDPGYLRVAKLFFDYASPFCPFALHNLLAHRGRLGRQLGEWFGPEASCRLLQDSRQAAIPLVAEDLPQVVVSPAGRLCLAELQAAVKATSPSNGLSPPSSSPPANAAAPPDPPQQQQHDLDAGENLADPQQQQQEKQQEVVHPEEEKLHQQPQSQAPPSTDRDEQALLIFVPVRLGLDRINPIYAPSLLKLFAMPQCLGMIGGRPRSSLYFVGTHRGRLLYLDPHTVQEVPRMIYQTQEDFRSFHCDTVSEVALENIDPSLVIGFYCNGTAQLACLWDCLQELRAEAGAGFPFAMFEEPPKQMDLQDLATGEDLSGDEDSDDFILVG